MSFLRQFVPLSAFSKIRKAWCKSNESVGQNTTENASKLTHHMLKNNTDLSQGWEVSQIWEVLDHEWSGKVLCILNGRDTRLIIIGHTFQDPIYSRILVKYHQKYNANSNQGYTLYGRGHWITWTLDIFQSVEIYCNSWTLHLQKLYDKNSARLNKM